MELPLKYSNSVALQKEANMGLELRNDFWDKEIKKQNHGCQWDCQGRKNTIKRWERGPNLRAF